MASTTHLESFPEEPFFLSYLHAIDPVCIYSSENELLQHNIGILEVPLSELEIYEKQRALALISHAFLFFLLLSRYCFPSLMSNTQTKIMSFLYLIYGMW